MSTTRVRVKSRREWPEGHPMDLPGYASAPENGEWLTVLLPPITDPSWSCGTEFLWRVSDEDVRAKGMDPSEPCHVCIHQIEAD